MGESMGYGGGGQSTTKGLEAKPGDRGDAKNLAGCRSIATPKAPEMPEKLRSECSEGYESANTGWHGNVKR